MEDYNELVASAKEILDVKKEELDYVKNEALKAKMNADYIDEKGLSWKADLRDAEENYKVAQERYQEVIKLHEKC